VVAEQGTVVLALDPLVSSQVLVRRARERDASAIASLYERYRDRLRAALRKKLGPRYRRALLDSEDAVHDGILAALHGIERFEYREQGSFLAWLLRVAETEVLQRLREQRAAMRDRDREVPLELAAAEASPAATPSEVAAGHETEERIERCLAALSAQEREVIVLRRYVELSNDEIRDELGLPSAGAARALLSRAQARLAVLLEESAGR
jgi:RNA polymerase sigma-70 factor (ECF subfamily)